MEGPEEEDYTGCDVTCNAWVDDSAWFTAKVLDKVAKGGWGQIYLAEVRSGPATGEFVAIKFVTTGSTFTLTKIDEMLYRLFNIEANCLIGLSGSPDVAQLLATCEVQKYGYLRYGLVLEWMAYGDVQMLLERSGRALSVDLAGTIMLSVLRALSTAHSAGYMHRDVKASNILLGSEGQVQLADWGICAITPDALKEEAENNAAQLHSDAEGQTLAVLDATNNQDSDKGLVGSTPTLQSIDGPKDQGHEKEEGESSAPLSSGNEDESSAKSETGGGSGLFVAGAPLGTPFWAAPELDLGLPHDESVDIWSFGITFIELVTGRQPWYDTSPSGLAHLTDPQMGFMPVDMPEDVLSWLKPCLSVDTSGRPTAAQLLEHPFFKSIFQALEQRSEVAREAAIIAHAATEAAEVEGSSDEEKSNATQLVSNAILLSYPPWLEYAHSLGMGGGMCSTKRFSRDGTSSGSGGWSDLPLVVESEWDGVRKVNVGDQTTADPDHMKQSGFPSLIESNDSESNSGPVTVEEQTSDNQAYPHLDPEVVEEMRRLQMM